MVSGRRRLPLVVATVTLTISLFTFLLFTPQASNGFFIAICGTLILLSLSHTLFSILHSSIGAEFAGESQTRDKVYMAEAEIECLGILLCVGLPALLQKLLNHCDCSFCVDVYEKIDIDCMRKCATACNFSLNQDAFIYPAIAVFALLVPIALVLVGKY